MLRYRLLDAALQRDLLPDPVLRAGSRFGAGRARAARGAGRRRGAGAAAARAASGGCRPGRSPRRPTSANEQHYELPAEFFGLFLGPRRKYSGCLWADGVSDLAGAEEAMLALTCARAGIQDGMDILDLGCGWGSLSLWLAEHYPNARILGVSNSNGQREWIEAEARAARLRQPRDRHAGRQRLRAGPAASTASSRSRCSSTCATGRSCCAASRPG